MSPPALSKLSIEELIVRARAQEKGALDELLRKCRRHLKRWAEKLPEAPGGNKPSDIVQVSALRAFEKFSSFKGDNKSELFAWLKAIVSSQAIQLARQALSQKRDDSGNVPLDTDMGEVTPASQHSPSHLSSVHEQARQLLRDIRNLSEEQCEAVSLVYVTEFSTAQAASRMGKSKEAVESLVQRGLRTLRKQKAGAASATSEDSPQAAAVQNAADAALLTYLRRREAGEDVDPDAFAARYPECQAELRDMLHWIERLRTLKPPGDS
jgi:RNA polymerase sigma-70 factor (ECF subfamily)